MRVIDTIRKVYEEHCDIFEGTYYSKYQWFVDHILELTTYDGEISDLFGRKIVEVCKAIMDRKTYEYIDDENNYITYIIVYNLLQSKEWINWGTSIRGAWFEESSSLNPIINWSYSDREGIHSHRVAFSEKNLRTLIEFIEEE